MSKAINAILIGAYLHIPYIYYKIEIWEKMIMLGTYKNMVQFWPFKSL